MYIRRNYCSVRRSTVGEEGANDTGAVVGGRDDGTRVQFLRGKRVFVGYWHSYFRHSSCMYAATFAPLVFGCQDDSVSFQNALPWLVEIYAKQV